MRLPTPEPAPSGGEILRLRLRMTGNEGARNDTREMARNGIFEAVPFLFTSGFPAYTFRHLVQS